MKEFIDKLISRLQEATYDMEICEEQFDMNSPYFMDVDYKMVKFDDAKTIINELAEEYNNGWIPCSERLPEERDSVFAKLKGTSKWKDGMFEKTSDDVNVTIEYKDDTRKTLTTHTVDGKWKKDYFADWEVIAWQPLPEPYKPQKLEWKDKVMKHFTNVE